MKSISQLIIELHELARDIKDNQESLNVRLIANELAQVGNRLHDKGYYEMATPKT